MLHLSPLKSHPDKLLKDHLTNVAESSAYLFNSIKWSSFSIPNVDSSSLERMIYVIGACHDVGKATRYFQEYVRNKKSRLRNSPLKAHSSLSALYSYYAIKRVLGESRLNVAPLWALMMVQRHHGLLKKPSETIVNIFSWSKKYMATQISSVEEVQELDGILSKLGLPRFTHFANNIEEVRDEVIYLDLKTNIQPKTVSNEGLMPFFLFNSMFSALIDADRMDASGLSFPKRKIVESQSVKDHVASLSARKQNTDEADIAIIEMRNHLFKALSEKARNIPLQKRILSLTAPTGSGKTLTGLHFALTLRERLSSFGNIPRIIYVAPYLSILDQNSGVFREALDLDKTQSDLLIVHHHLAEMRYGIFGQDQETFSGLKSELLIEGWNSEIIVTTFIQFFYAVLGTTASQLRKLHNLEGSIVILDEVQSIPHSFWPLVHDALKFLADRLNVYIILMTATQPLIFARNEIAELVERSDVDPWGSRITFEFIVDNPISLSEFESTLDQRIKREDVKSILVLMNTIASANEVFNHIKNTRKKFFLSANVLPMQRKERIYELQTLLRSGQPLILTSTQVIEAGVDLDFDLVLRDLGPIDSIIQAAGRCNRNGRKNPLKSKVCVYRIKNKKGYEFSRQIYGNYLIEKTLETIAEFPSGSSKMVEAYYQKVREGASEETSSELLEAMKRLNYNDIRDGFKLIEDEPRCSVYVEFDDRAVELWQKFVDIMNSKRSSFERKEAFLKMKSDFYDYVVNVRARDTLNLDESYGFYYVPYSIRNTFYDCDLGFKRRSREVYDDENIIW